MSRRRKGSRPSDMPPQVSVICTGNKTHEAAHFLRVSVSYFDDQQLVIEEPAAKWLEQPGAAFAVQQVPRGLEAQRRSLAAADMVDSDERAVYQFTCQRCRLTLGGRPRNVPMKAESLLRAYQAAVAVGESLIDISRLSS